MEKYFINYNTGEGNEKVEVYDLNEAKEIAVGGMAYTGQDVVIETLSGEEVTRSKWVGVGAAGIDEELILIKFGDFGYYMRWTDELENV